MVTLHRNDTLGMGINPYLSSRKEWIATALSVGAGLASSLFGGMKASEAAKEAAKQQRLAENKEHAWYSRRYNEDYLDTAAGQNLVRRAKDFARENWRKARGAQVVGGASDASAQMAKDAGNTMVGDTIANIAAVDAEKKAQTDQIHMQNEQNFTQQNIQREQQKAQNVSNAAGQASNALMSAAGALESGAKPNLMGGNNGGVTIDPSVTDGTLAQKMRQDAFGG